MWIYLLAINFILKIRLQCKYNFLKWNKTETSKKILSNPKWDRIKKKKKKKIREKIKRQ